MSYTAEFPIGYIPNPDKFGALAGGDVYFGVPNGSPATVPGDQVQVYAARQGLSDLAIAQPVDIGPGGEWWYSGQPVQIKVLVPYCVQVMNSLGVQKYYAPAAGDEIAKFIEIENEMAATIQTVATFADLSSTTATIGQQVQTSGHTVAGYGGGLYDVVSSSGQVADNGLVAVNGAIAFVKRINGAVSQYDFGAIDGADGTAAVQDALDCDWSEVTLEPGDVLISSTLTPPGNKTIRWAEGCAFKPTVNGLTFFESTTTCYSTKFYNPQLHANGKTGVVGFDMTNFRLNAGIFDPFFYGINTGFIGREGCFGTIIENPTAFACENPIICLADNSGMVIQNPTFDNSAGAGGTGTGNGVRVYNGSPSNLGVSIIGGYIQGFTAGVLDEAIGTIVERVYFENCTDDISAATGARNGTYAECGHWGSVGNSSYKLRNTDAMHVSNPVTGSGARTQVFDVDSSNTNCSYFMQNSNASLNSPLGSVTYLSGVSLQSKGTFTPTIAGSSTAGVGTYTKQYGTWNRDGDIVTIEITVTITAHTGTGSFLIKNIPTALIPASYDAKQFPLYVSGFAFTGPVIYCGFNGSSTDISCYQIDTAGAVSLIGIGAVGTLSTVIQYSMA